MARAASAMAIALKRAMARKRAIARAARAMVTARRVVGTKRTMARVAKVMVTTTSQAMATAIPWAMAMAMRVADNKEYKGKDCGSPDSWVWTDQPQI